MQITFNNIEVPEEELKAVVEKNMEQIQKQCRRKKVRRILTGCSAAVILAAAGIGFCAMNPVLAEQIPLIGHLFERVEDKQIYSGELSKDAEPVRDGNVSESGGIKMTYQKYTAIQKQSIYRCWSNPKRRFRKSNMMQTRPPGTGQSAISIWIWQRILTSCRRGCRIPYK